MVKGFLIKNKLSVTGTILGAMAGYNYYTASACTDGSCIITATPFNTMAYGALMGGLLFSIFQKARTADKKN